MATLNIPANPSVGRTYEENGVIYTWTGTHWTASVIETYASGPLAGFRNQIINGSMQINQRFGLNDPQTAANGFAVDRWRCTDGTNYSQQSSTNNWDDGFDNHILINTTGNATIYQHIELHRPGVPAPFAVGTTWTLSAYVAANQNTFDIQPWVVFTDGGTGTGNQTNVFNPAATSVTPATSALERVSWTFTVPSNPAASNTSLTVFLIGSNTGGSISISGVQLEPGPVATPFEHRPIGTELALCERYYYGTRLKYGDYRGVIGLFNNSYAQPGRIFFPVTMRATPTVIQVSTFTNALKINGGAGTTSSTKDLAVHSIPGGNHAVWGTPTSETINGTKQLYVPGTDIGFDAEL